MFVTTKSENQCQCYTKVTQTRNMKSKMFSYTCIHVYIVIIEMLGCSLYFQNRLLNRLDDELVFENCYSKVFALQCLCVVSLFRRETKLPLYIY